MITYTGGYEDLDLAPDDISFMNHRSGNTVDLSILDSNGDELNLGDVQYNEKDSINYYNENKPKNKEEEIIKNNRQMLIDVMTNNNFEPYKKEWWHWGYFGDEV